MITLFVPLLLMAVFGAYVGLTSSGETKEAYTLALRDGLVFMTGPVVAAAGLFVLFKLLTWPFRSRD